MVQQIETEKIKIVRTKREAPAYWLLDGKFQPEFIKVTPKNSKSPSIEKNKNLIETLTEDGKPSQKDIIESEINPFSEKIHEVYLPQYNLIIMYKDLGSTEKTNITQNGPNFFYDNDLVLKISDELPLFLIRAIDSIYENILEICGKINHFHSTKQIQFTEIMAISKQSKQISFIFGIDYTAYFSSTYRPGGKPGINGTAIIPTSKRHIPLANKIADFYVSIGKENVLIFPFDILSLTVPV